MAMEINEYMKGIRRELSVSVSDMEKISNDFIAEMRAGLEGRTSSLKMLPSYISKPTGKEKGSVVAIDFGGTNVRILQADLDGSGKITVNAKNKFPLVDPDGKYNYTAKEATGEQLFDYIAEHVGEISIKGVENSLGHTFSFPCKQNGINSAELIYWTKEIKTSGVEGHDVSKILEDSLKRKKIENVTPKAVINDTVGTLLAAAYSNTDVDMAAICGTGHNACYLEPNHPLTGKPMIVNIESGNFNKVPQSRFDAKIDAASERPGLQKLEKMISGYYLGEIIRVILEQMMKDGVLPESSEIVKKDVIYGADIDNIIADSADFGATEKVMKDKLGLASLNRDQLFAVKEIVDMVSVRSARLVAAIFVGIIYHIDKNVERKHVIAIDGSLYEKIPNYDVNIQMAMDELFREKSGKVSTILAKDGSGIGAAIAAATA